MLILIEKDEHTKIPREVRDIDEAKAIAREGFGIFVVNEDNTHTALKDWKPAPPAEDAVQAAAEEPAPAAKKPTAKKAAKG